MVGKVLSYVMIAILFMSAILVGAQVVTNISIGTGSDLTSGDWITFMGGIIGSGLAVGGVYWATHKQVKISTDALDLEKSKFRQQQDRDVTAALLILEIELVEYHEKLHNFSTTLTSLIYVFMNADGSDLDLKYRKNLIESISYKANERYKINIQKNAEYIATLPDNIKKMVMLGLKQNANDINLITQILSIIKDLDIHEGKRPKGYSEYLIERLNELSEVLRSRLLEIFELDLIIKNEQSSGSVEGERIT